MRLFMQVVETGVDDKREPSYDLFKGIGILLVLFGHFIEPFREINPVFNLIFVIIYSFHMPLFCFLTGLVAKFQIVSIMKYGILYGIMQLVYTLFRCVALGERIDSFTTIIWMTAMPFWHMWYLYAMLFWLISIPIIKVAAKYISCIFVLVLTLFGGLISGFYSLPYSLMRVVSFFPYFAGGGNASWKLSALG